MKFNFNKIMITLLFLQCIGLVATEQTKGLRINTGDEFHYEIVKLQGDKKVVTDKLTERALESSYKAGHSCVEYETNFKNRINSRYCRTDSTGLYFYFEKYIKNYSELFPELNNFWLKYIDFQNKEWTQFSFVHDSTYSKEHKENLEIGYSGKFIKEIDVELNGKQYKAIVTRSSITTKRTVEYEGETSTYDSEIAMEYTYINGIGLYKAQRIYDGELVEWYQILKEVKK